MTYLFESLRRIRISVIHIDNILICLFLVICSLYDIKIGRVSMPYVGSVLLLFYFLMRRRSTVLTCIPFLFCVVILIVWDLLVTANRSPGYLGNPITIESKAKFYLNLVIFVFLYSFFLKHNERGGYSRQGFILFSILILVQLSGFFLLGDTRLYEIAPDVVRARKLNMYFSDANYLSAYVILIFSLTYYFFRTKLELIACYVVSCVLVVLTFSRAGILLMSVSGVFVLNRIMSGTRRLDYFRKLSTVLVIGLVVFYVIRLNPGIFAEVGARFAYNVYYGEPRFAIWHKVIEMLSVTGIGFGIFEVEHSYIITPHNLYLELILSFGVFSLLIFYMMFTKLHRALRVFPLLHLNLFVLCFFFSFGFVTYAWFFLAFLSAARQTRGLVHTV